MNVPVTAAACGKLILLGEHFVVHGAPALALPVRSMETRVTVRQGQAGVAPALEVDVPAPARRTAQDLVRSALESMALDPSAGWRISVESTLPMGFGLGSSASLSVALTRALSLAAAAGLSAEAINRHAHGLERLVHGSPSGIDNTVVTYERPVWFIRDRPVEVLDSPRSLVLVLASSSHPGSTRQAVSQVRAFGEADADHFSRLRGEAADVARQGRAAFQAGEGPALGRLMDRNHALLRTVGVSTPELDTLVRRARAAGALGAKLTGAGLGGFIVALVAGARRRHVMQALVEAGASRVVCEGGSP